MDSKRLPGKVLLNLAGRPVLDYVLDKAKKINISEIIIATSIRKLDDPIADFAKNRSIVCFRGEFENVLDRAIQCAKYFSAECILRICGDSPFISFDLANYALDIMKKKNPKDKN